MFKQKLLIEEPSIPILNNSNAFFAKLICAAKGYKPVLLLSKKNNYNNFFYSLHLEEYEKHISRLPKIKTYLLSKYVWLVSYIKCFTLFFGKSIIELTYSNIKYGDLIYDQYLVEYEQATIKKIDSRLAKIIYQCIFRHHIVLSAIKKTKAKAVLVSQQVSIKTGVMLRVAIKHGLEGYLRAGHHESTLQKFTKLEEIYDYEYKPSPKELEKLIKKLGKKINKKYINTLAYQVSGKGTKEGLDAYNANNKYYKSKKQFSNKYKLNNQKANVFVMLHALNDHPHSHFGKMLFKDYYDWMMTTLAIAKQNNKVNWIFKQHPSVYYYSTKDVDYHKIFSNLPKNIRYIDEKNQIDTRSLKHCADLVATCAGSAGFELPALGGIPSIVGGKNHYSGLGIAYEPKNKTQYTQYLLNICKKPPKLSSKIISRARATYIFIYDTSRFPVHYCPQVTMSDEKSANQDEWYHRAVNKQKKLFNKEIKSEISTYIKLIRQKNFYKLTKLDL
jgi:hypothetical protein